MIYTQPVLFSPQRWNDLWVLKSILRPLSLIGQHSNRELCSTMGFFPPGPNYKICLSKAAWKQVLVTCRGKQAAEESECLGCYFALLVTWISHGGLWRVVFNKSCVLFQPHGTCFGLPHSPWLLVWILFYLILESFQGTEFQLRKCLHKIWL